ncbi:hypothetical protein F7725_026221 [Dissostichus mawsoni]|uniref:Centromere protein N n=1 Tax=Dissostichus mawsoni TaxID=36200 RepID=A0A7J5X6F0_DISMA|nr:hypothetical protein F7725_026221 [Dissostichus mawsoni]
MDESKKRLVQRLMRRIPTKRLKTTLEKWGRLTGKQQRAMDSIHSKWALTESLLAICEENELAVKHLTELEMIYMIDNPDQGMWYAFQLTDPGDDAQSVDLMQFKEQFKSHLKEIVREVSVKIKKHTDEAVWIRIAWGDTYSPRPSQTNICCSLSSNTICLCDPSDFKAKAHAMVLSTRYQYFKDANLSGRNLTAIRDLLMRKYQQVFPTKYPSPLTERKQTVTNPHIERDQAKPAANRLQMACEAFGGGVTSATLETRFRDHSNTTMTEREEPFRCVVKFSSANLLESLKSCASSGIASTPVTPLLSFIPLKGKNYFVITDKGPVPSSQMHQTQN